MPGRRRAYASAPVSAGPNYLAELGTTRLSHPDAARPKDDVEGRLVTLDDVGGGL